MTAPSPDLQETLEWAEKYRRLTGAGLSWSDLQSDITVLADEIYRLRNELADETKHRLVLAATMESDWAEQCNAMAAVVRAADELETAVVGGQSPIRCSALSKILWIRVREFRASGFADDVLTEDRT